MAKGLIMARAMKQLRLMLSDKIMEDVVELQGSPSDSAPIATAAADTRRKSCEM